MSNKLPEVFMGLEVVPLEGMKPGTLVLIPNKQDVTLNDVWMITNIDTEGKPELAMVQPIPKELTGDDLWLSLIMEMVNSSRNEQKERYREVKKEIKRLMLEDKEARKFFQTAFNSVKF